MRKSFRISAALIAAVIAAILVATCSGGGNKHKTGSIRVAPPTAPPAPASTPAPAAMPQREHPPRHTHKRPQHPRAATPAVSVPPPRPAPQAAAPATPPVARAPAARPGLLKQIHDNLLTAAALVAGAVEHHITAWMWDASPDTARGPQAPLLYDGKLYMLDANNGRIAVFSLDAADGAPILATVIGQAGKTQSTAACDAATLNGPLSVSVADGKVVVADGANNRVLIWNSIPTTDGAPADIVLGQPDMETCSPNGDGTTGAATLAHPGGAWTDGTRVVVLDRDNNRVLIWNRFPTRNGQPADQVLGQRDFASHAPDGNMGGLDAPEGGVFVNGRGQLFVRDAGNHRILVWREFPEANRQPADVSLKDDAFAAEIAGGYADEFRFLYPATVSAPPDRKKNSPRLELDY